MTAVLQFPTKRAERASAPESAKALKQALQARFPATKFSVTIARGTAYGDCTVSWTDGPTVKAVDPITWPFEGQTFDGMTDMREYTRATLPDGRESGLHLILTHRRTSPTLARKAAAQVAKFYGLELPTILEENGYWMVPNDNKWVRDDIREYWSTLIHQACADHSRFTA